MWTCFSAFRNSVIFGSVILNNSDGLLSNSLDKIETLQILIYDFRISKYHFSSHFPRLHALSFLFFALCFIFACVCVCRLGKGVGEAEGKGGGVGRVQDFVLPAVQCGYIMYALPAILLYC